MKDKGAAVVIFIVLCLGLVACSVSTSDVTGELNANLAKADSEEDAPEDSGTYPNAQAEEKDSGSEVTEGAAGDSPNKRPTSDELLIIEERAPIPDTWIVEEFGKMADRQRKLVVDTIDDETYQLLVEEYGEEEVVRYRDDDGE